MFIAIMGMFPGSYDIQGGSWEGLFGYMLSCWVCFITKSNIGLSMSVKISFIFSFFFILLRLHMLHEVTV